MAISTVEILKRYYDPGSKAYCILFAHGRAVCQKATSIAFRMTDLNPDVEFIREAAMLHDIGIFMTQAPELGCTGGHPYICHGYLGSRLLNDLGLPKHARVCETHVGVGLSRQDIIENRLPLPDRNMLPETIEERIVCYADKFYSKNGDLANGEKSIETITRELAAFGKGKAKTFLQWMEQLGC